MLTHDVISAAIGTHATAVARFLNCSRTLVHRHRSAPKSVRFHNFLETFLRWLRAIYRAHRPGGELLIAHCEAEFAALRAGVVTVATSAEVRRQWAHVDELRAEVNRLALERADERRMIPAVTRLRAGLQRFELMLRGRSEKRRQAA